jgi:hypothetical protein
MKLIQINFTQDLSEQQKADLIKIFPNEEIHYNGISYIKVTGMEFSNQKWLSNFKRAIAKSTGIELVNILFTKEEN